MSTNQFDPQEEGIDTPETIIASILRGEYDNHLNEIHDAVQQRRENTKWKRAKAFHAGDRVKMVRGRPHYLIGAYGTVRKVMQVYVILDLDQPNGKFHRNIRTPIDLIEKVES